MHGPAELELFVERLEAIGAPYMITGATAAIIYGQPRVTNDLDVVIELDDGAIAKVLRTFPEEAFYVPPEAVIRAESARMSRGHFNVIHHESGYKADMYLAGSDSLHRWALAQRKRVEWSDGRRLWVAPPEYVVLRKMEFFREGGSAKHPADIRAICDITGVDEAAMQPWVERLGLAEIWREMKR